MKMWECGNVAIGNVGIGNWGMWGLGNVGMNEKMKKMGKTNLILDLTLKFALEVIKYVELLEEKKKYVVGKQLLKSGTSIGANTCEAQSAESKADFTHKFKIANKEIKETKYWLMLCESSISYPNPPMELMKQIQDIENIISKIIISAKRT
jgi:four helix bundle protein